METRFPLGGIVVSKTGTGKQDLLLWKITHRDGDKIRLHPLLPAFTLKGNLIPGVLDPHAKSIHRKISSTYGGENLAPVAIGHFAAGLHPWDSRLKRMGRGGKRAGAGRKKGSGKGRNAITKGITLTIAEWEQIKSLCGSAGISEFFRQRIFGTEKKFEKIAKND